MRFRYSLVFICALVMGLCACKGGDPETMMQTNQLDKQTESSTPNETSQPSEDIVPVDEKVESIDVYHSLIEKKYAIFTEENEYSSEGETEEIVNRINVPEEYSSLNEALDQIFVPVIQEFDQNFSDDLTTIQTNDQFAGQYSYYDFDVVLYQANTRFLCFTARKGVHSLGSQQYEYTTVGYNFSTQSGELICLKDVIKDNGLFFEYTSQVVPLDLYEITRDEFIDRVNSESIPYILSYDGIYLIFENYLFKVSAMGHEDVFNMEFFGKTPEYYAIESSRDHTVLWDIDGDQELDILSIDFDSESMASVVNIQDTQTVLSPAEFNCYDYYGFEIEKWYLVYTDTGFYIVACSDGGSGGIEFDSLHSFKVNADNTVTLIESKRASEYPLIVDPTSFVITDFSNLGGACDFSNDYTLIGTNGIFQCDDYFTRTRSVMQTKTDIIAYMDGSNEELTIPSGTNFTFVGFDSNYMYMKTIDIHGCYSDETYKLTIDRSEYSTLIAGGDPTELFKNCEYGG